MANIFIAGHNGLVGSALTRKLNKTKNTLILKDRNSLDLCCQKSVDEFFKKNIIDQVYFAAAKVGGIYANSKFPANFIYENLQMQINVINSAYKYKVKKLLFLGSSCIYPKEPKLPINERALLTGKLEQSNEPYAIAKIAGIKICESYNRQYGTDFRSVMPTNLYGINDNFHKENSHVIPGIIIKMHQAKVEKKDKVIIWGSGKPLREFLNSDDLAEACIFIMNLSKKKYNTETNERCSQVNIGSGKEISIKELAYLIREIVDYDGEIFFDKKMPDGTYSKILDSSLINKIGWKPKIHLRDGIKSTYQWYLSKLV